MSQLARSTPRLAWVSWACVGLLAGCQAARSPVYEWAAGSGGRRALPEAGGAAPPRPATAGSGPIAPAAGNGGGGFGGESGNDAAFDTDVDFEWSQTLPSRGSCAGAAFVGGFTCTFDNGLISATQGTIVLELRGPNEVQQLEPSSGALDLLTDPAQMISLGLPMDVGPVACVERKLTGQVPATMFTADQVGVGFSVGLTLFCAAPTSAQGTLSGELSADGQSLTGEVSLMIGSCSCRGAFDLRAQR